MMFFAGFLLFSSVFSRGYGASYTLQQAEAARKVMNRCDPAVGISDGEAHPKRKHKCERNAEILPKNSGTAREKPAFERFFGA
eukprot:scaffold458_cov206-Pinguiococcus_pyrenoidosus.AAC.1